MSNSHNPFIHNKKRKWHSIRKAFALNINNILCRSTILHADGPVVCLTSHGDRVASVHISIESISQGDQKPSRIILWLDNDEVDKPLPKSIQRLQRRGLEVSYAARRGPHNKYYAYVSQASEHNLPLVTADDDVIYPNWWLRVLKITHDQSPQQIHCFRAHRFTFRDDKVAPYAQWQECATTTPSMLNFATGVSGIIYPAAFQAELKCAGEAFLDYAPKADDVWLHAIAVRGGWHIHQIYPKAIHFEEIRANRHLALHKENVSQGGNDLQIRDTYTQQDLEKLWFANLQERQNGTQA